MGLLTKTISLASLAIALLSACSVAPKNLDSRKSDIDGSFTRQVEKADMTPTPVTLPAPGTEAAYDSPVDLSTQRFSRGDLIKLSIQNMDNYNGLYQINSNGILELPINESVPAAGSTRAELVLSIRSILHSKDWFPDLDTLVDASLVRGSAIDVSVHGAVFSQGRVTINAQPNTKQEDAIQQYAGSHSNDRDLVAAILAAGGIRPDANLENVLLVRHGKVHSMNLTELFSGSSFKATPSLIHGDQIYVASKGRENSNLIRPSQITPPGMRVLMSNLTAPSLSNALSAIGADSTRLPYGSSLLDGALSANCVGGTHQANASRTVLLITRHYGSKQQLVIKRTVNQLLASSSEHNVNPFLMPNDGIACYDSRFTNIRDVARGIGEIFGPIILRGVL